MKVDYGIFVCASIEAFRTHSLSSGVQDSSGLQDSFTLK